MRLVVAAVGVVIVFLNCRKWLLLWVLTGSGVACLTGPRKERDAGRVDAGKRIEREREEVGWWIQIVGGC